MNKALELLHKQWYDTTEGSAEHQKLYNLFCNTGDEANDNMNFATIAKATFSESEMAFCAGFHTAMSILIENNHL